MGRSSLAHRQVTTRAGESRDDTFGAFCERQRSRVRAYLAYRVTRHRETMNDHIQAQAFDVEQRGYGIGGGKSNYGHGGVDE